MAMVTTTTLLTRQLFVHGVVVFSFYVVVFFDVIIKIVYFLFILNFLNQQLIPGSLSKEIKSDNILPLIALVIYFASSDEELIF